MKVDLRSLLFQNKELIEKEKEFSFFYKTVFILFKLKDFVRLIKSNGIIKYLISIFFINLFDFFFKITDVYNKKIKKLSINELLAVDIYLDFLCERKKWITQEYEYEEYNNFIHYLPLYIISYSYKNINSIIKALYVLLRYFNMEKVIKRAERYMKSFI